MKAIEMILRKFKPDEPILVEDILKMFPDRSRQWVDNTLSNMIASKQIIRYSTGVYYIPNSTGRGSSNLNPYKVIEKKYITDGDSVYGYYGGKYLIRKLGPSQLFPEVITVITNREKSRGRMIRVGDKEVYLIKSPTGVTKENQTTLQLLEVIRLIDINTFSGTIKEHLINYILNNRITITDVRQSCDFFPDVVSKRILTGYVYDFLHYNERKINIER